MGKNVVHFLATRLRAHVFTNRESATNQNGHFFRLPLTRITFAVYLYVTSIPRNTISLKFEDVEFVVRLRLRQAYRRTTPRLIRKIFFVE